MGHDRVHKIIRREPETVGDGKDASDIFATTRITGVDTNAPIATATAITTDTGTQSVLTTVISTVELPITQPASTFTTTEIQTIRVTDAAQFSSLQASQSSANAQTTSSKSTTAAATTTTAAAAAGSSSSSNNLTKLIPAIVVPIAAVLIISFAVFWFMMRRRLQKQLQDEPDFVMAGKPEKALSRGNSNSSGHSSTRELVPMSKLEKEVVVTTTPDVKRSAMDLFPPKYSPADIGVARPMTPPDQKSANSGKKAFTNFSSVRPGIPATPGNGTRSRSQSTSAPRGAQTPRSASRNAPPISIRAPSPTMHGSPNLYDRNPRSQNVQSPPGARSPPQPGLGYLSTNMNHGNRAAPPQPLSPPTPTGAFNGASPISQYSPIVKGTPSIGVAAFGDQAAKHDQPPPLKTSGLPKSTSTNSPVDENVLSPENMRIARLANSSRLGFNHSPVEATFSSRAGGNQRTLPPLSERDSKLDGLAISPRLPPPLTREDPASKPFGRGPDSPDGRSSIYASPSIGPGATPQLPQIGGGYSTTSLAHSDLNTIGFASSSGLHNRISVASGVSTDDGYVDMELDAKSEVSSLDEREEWEVESDRRVAGSQLGTGYAGSGYGSAAMSPVGGPAATASSAGTGKSKPNIRDRDSEGPFVLSRY